MTGRSYAVPAPRAKVEISIERLVQWTYHDQRAHMAPAATGPVSRSNFDDFDDIAELGWLVSGSSLSAGALHDDASAIHDVVARMAPDARRTLMVHGFMRTRPDPHVGAHHHLGPAGWDVFEHPHNPGTYLRSPKTANETKNGGWYVPLIEIDRPFEVRRDRRDWLAWAGGLADLHGRVGRLLTAYALTDELPELRPWGDSGCYGV